MQIIVKNTDFIIEAKNTLDLPLKQGKKIVKVYLDKVKDERTKTGFNTVQNIETLKTYNSNEEAFLKLQNMREAFLNGQKEFILE